MNIESIINNEAKNQAFIYCFANDSHEAINCFVNNFNIDDLKDYYNYLFTKVSDDSKPYYKRAAKILSQCDKHREKEYIQLFNKLYNEYKKHYE